MSIERITTSDGSHSLRNTVLDETYHSAHGALQESRYVFIRQGLEYFATSDAKEPIRIFEVGFGTGLNALLTLAWANHRQRVISYTTIEPFPLPEKIWADLNYGSLLNDLDSLALLHRAAWGTDVALTPFFRLLKLQENLHDWTPAAKWDVIYFDAFAPNKQPGMWTVDVLNKVVDAMEPGGVFVTYCAKGQLKRDLRSLGLEVETLPGPPGKKEMVRARSPRPTDSPR